MDYVIYDYFWRLSQSGMDKANTLTFNVYEQPISDFVLPETEWDFSASFSTTQSGAILDNFFVFEMKEGATYDIFISSYFDPYLLHLYDNLGNVIAFDSNFISDYVAPYTGTYYAEAGWHQGLASGHKYVSISVYEDIDTIPLELSGTTDDFLGDINTTGSLTLGSTVFGEIEVPTDEDWFEIQLDTGTTYLLSAQSTGLGETTLQLRDNNGSIIKADIQRTGETSAFIEFTPTVSSTYYMTVKEMNNRNTGSYSINLDAIDSLPTLSDTDIDRIFNWGESVYTDLFTEHHDSQDIFGYYARIYSNGDALGEQDGNIYYYDGGTGGTGDIILAGKASDYLPQAEAAGF